MPRIYKLTEKEHVDFFAPFFESPFPFPLAWVHTRFPDTLTFAAVSLLRSFVQPRPFPTWHYLLCRFSGPEEVAKAAGVVRDVVFQNNGRFENARALLS
jgi:hypothetical protein